LANSNGCGKFIWEEKRKLCLTIGIIEAPKILNMFMTFVEIKIGEVSFCMFHVSSHSCSGSNGISSESD
jgi:hypothetical protein